MGDTGVQLIFAAASIAAGSSVTVAGGQAFAGALNVYPLEDYIAYPIKIAPELRFGKLQPITLMHSLNESMQVNKLPAPLRPLLDAELAAGNTIKDVESVGVDPGR